MAEFWWGATTKTELRQHLNYYPACRGKCKPILTWMLQGLDVDPDPESLGFQRMELKTVYEDEWLLVVDKPSGMLSTPGRIEDYSVETIMQQRYPGSLIAHRLDMGTSGLLIVAKSLEVYRPLQEQFVKHQVRKKYVAVLADSSPLMLHRPAADSSLFTLHSSLKKMPQGIRESINAVGPTLAMPVVTAICPCIGTLATGVTLDVHGQKKGLNLISYIAGDFASGKGGIDPVVEAWMSEVQALDKMYQMQEDEWRAKKRAAKNKKEQPEEPKLPVRCLTLNNTVANLAERLANTEGKHAFSFTPEADTVAQKWKSTMSDFSVMLRQSYDGTKYEREARSADAVNVHIEKLLWNVCMCGTPDALYRVVSNYTDGFQSRIAVARTPDNTFADRPPARPHTAGSPPVAVDVWRGGAAQTGGKGSRMGGAHPSGDDEERRPHACPSALPCLCDGAKNDVLPDAVQSM